eukprot:3065309-Alexandrium_andersonii.AAC.1
MVVRTRPVRMSSKYWSVKLLALWRELNICRTPSFAACGASMCLSGWRMSAAFLNRCRTLTSRWRFQSAGAMPQNSG